MSSPQPIDTPGSSNDDPESDVASLPSSSASSSSLDSEEEQRVHDAEKEWKESLQQLELLLTMVIVPYAGKYYGRKFAFWVWAKYMTWKFPVEVVVTSPKTFKAAGAIEAAASL